MKAYKFKKDQDQYKAGQVIKVENENKLVKQYIKEGVLVSVSKAKAEKK